MLFGLGLVGWGWAIVVCAVPFGVGGSCLVQASMAGVGRGRSQAVRALGLVGWGWSGVVWGWWVGAGQ